MFLTYNVDCQLAKYLGFDILTSYFLRLPPLLNLADGGGIESKFKLDLDLLYS